MNATIKRERRYERAGLLALDPHAFLSLFLLSDPPTENTEIGDVDVVDIRGPLEQHAGGWCDSYEAVRGRMRLACESPRKAIVLRIDSPGGAVAGAFNTARELRTMAGAVGKPVWAYVEGRAHSAGYAIACAAARVVLADTATVGSVGVINTRPDYSARDAADGLRYAVTASGARKTDGHPHVAITDGELKASQGIVDDMAEVFFELVAEMRGLTPAAVQGTEAGVFTGQGAIAAGLADEVGTFEATIAAISAGGENLTMNKPKAGDYEDGRSALERASKGEGKQAEAAKRALAAMDEEPKPKDDDKDGDAKKSDDEGDKPKDDDKDGDAKKSDDEGDKPKDDDKKDDKGDAKSSARSSTGSSIEERVSRLEAATTDSERTALLATRPDITPELAKVLATKPVSTVREILEATPKRAALKLAAGQAAMGTRGAELGEVPPSAEANEMDLRMGLVGEHLSVRRVGNVQQFGVFPKQPGAAAAGKEGAK